MQPIKKENTKKEPFSIISLETEVKNFKRQLAKVEEQLSRYKEQENIDKTIQ